jgi:nifR3 family TIM-barrel protein
MSFDIKGKVILAPMAGITDYAFRKISRNFGADYCVSEMISAKAVHFRDEKTATLAHIHDDDTPIGIQIFGHEPDTMAECAYLVSRGIYEHAINHSSPNFIDINMGCPVKKIVTSGDGSALMKNPMLCGEIIRKCVDASSVPVTVKIRAGWDKDSINAVEIAKIAEANGAHAICVHGRTREQMYEPYADWGIINEVKKSVNIPVIGNGDIFSASDAVNMINETGVDSIMIGRGALGNPFIFEEIKSNFNNISYTPPTISQKIKIAREHVRLMIEDKGEALAICESRKHLAWYVKGMRGAARIKDIINTCENPDEILEILNKLREE